MSMILEDSNSEENIDLPSHHLHGKTVKSLKRNFILFCVCFSVSHGSLDSVLSYSSSELGVALAGDAGSVLYTFYTMSSLFIAKPLNRNGDSFFVGP
mmetsp:Transcript_7019/g.7270  ORF Transcript_7019/g.7270 Transcript_7019/m.7270 type:complete len:97 (+) Transcript_7019:75-365(+)